MVCHVLLDIRVERSFDTGDYDVEEALVLAAQVIFLITIIPLLAS